MGVDPSATLIYGFKLDKITVVADKITKYDPDTGEPYDFVTYKKEYGIDGDDLDYKVDSNISDILYSRMFHFGNGDNPFFGITLASVDCWDDTYQRLAWELPDAMEYERLIRDELNKILKPECVDKCIGSCANYLVNTTG